MPGWVASLTVGYTASGKRIADEWTPRELRHGFVSLLSDNGTSIDEIAQLVGHSSTAVTEQVCRHQVRPVLQSGAAVMDQIFGEQPDA